jgi:hypothetical protein
VTTIVPFMSGPWIQQKYLYVPGVENVTFDERVRPGIGEPEEIGVAKNPFPCVVAPAYVRGLGSVPNGTIGVTWFGAVGPAGSWSVCFPHCSRYFFGPKTMLCTSLVDLVTNVTVDPALTLRTFG